ncbi:uncharacterized protein BP5553_06084 [Venustampulla echinocandica]|uniref:Yeast cell wall synthesis Kre9/Knh1-like N-terminal domain-containing protein n=1 Tax=Venustampulla echinocandica TaxID=2656787 RepID=A0A370TMI1_9HELO|nr:uncharacterized protein BP5553_06084 [Venustampulla echinocandica]RDL36732.1 hypothetical protein BP5553_06084 [Venustampulla echinocandica]
MRFSATIVALAALASSVVAQTAGFDVMTSPTQDQEIPAGSSFDIVWTPGSVEGTISITLMQGEAPKLLLLGETVASGIKNSLGKFKWTVPSTSAFKTYGFQLTLDSDPTTFQRSFPFHITGGSSSSSSANDTSTAAPTKNSTSSTASATSTSSSSKKSSSTAHATSTANSTSSSSAAPTAGPSSNLTSTLTTVSAPKTGSPTGGSPSSTGSNAPVTSKSAAAGNAISGGLAMVGGLVIAFAL